MLGEVNTSGKTVEEEIFRSFVMHHLIDAARPPPMSTISENDIPQPLQPFINLDHIDCKEDRNKEWAVFQRIQAERFFKGKGSAITSFTLTQRSLSSRMHLRLVSVPCAHL